MKCDCIPYDRVDITGGFWKRRQDLNAEKTLWAVKDRFEETGRFDAFKFDWREGRPNKPGAFWMGDIEKWIEGASYVLKKRGENPELERIIDSTAELIEAEQGKTGYYHIPISIFNPSGRWTNRHGHELYTAGHLIEAAVAYYGATGKDRLLNCAVRFADLIEKVFTEERSAAFATPGHEEIELALVKLYHCTGDRKYLNLSKFFIDMRGNNTKDQPAIQWANFRYEQSHLPVRMQTTAEGHAVRAMYLYCGMADIAYEFDDKPLADACKALFANISEKRMYITGGIGNCARDEGFTIDYDLPNLTAYSETCAGIGLIMFASRMFRLDRDSRYADVAERVLYNAFLSSVSLSGDSFFYENPMETDPRLNEREVFAKVPARMPPSVRQKVFTTSCCPPNIVRLVASLGGYLYSVSDNGGVLYVHHYMSSRAEVESGGQKMTVCQTTEYPFDGKISITVDNPTVNTVALRIPGWCEKWSLDINGSAVSRSPVKGYVYIPYRESGATVTLNLTMEPRWIEANPEVRDADGRVALQCGPFVYCLEGTDNGRNLRDIRADIRSPIERSFDEMLNVPVLKTRGSRRAIGETLPLYFPAGGRRVGSQLRFIPYFAFANRGETEMSVWIDG